MITNTQAKVSEKQLVGKVDESQGTVMEIEDKEIFPEPKRNQPDYDAKNSVRLAGNQQFFRTPKLLVYGKKYQQLSAVEVLAYIVLLDRQQVSQKNHWLDESGEVYFIYSNQALAEVLQVSIPTIIRIKRHLVAAGLLHEVKTGRANKLYLSAPEPFDESEYKYILTEETSEKHAKKGEINASNTQMLALEEPNAAPSSAKQINDSTAETKEEMPTLVKKRLPENLTDVSGEVKKVNTSKTNLTKTNINKLSAQSNESGETDQTMPLLTVKKGKGMISKSPTAILSAQQLAGESFRNQLPTQNIFDYTKQGIPAKITDLLYRWAKNMTDFKDMISSIFKAKSYVSRRLNSLVLLEELSAEEIDEWYLLMYRVMHKRQTDAKLGNFERYLMSSLINFFEEHAINEVKSIPTNLKENQNEVPLINWLETPNQAIYQKEPILKGA